MAPSPPRRRRKLKVRDFVQLTMPSAGKPVGFEAFISEIIDNEGEPLLHLMNSDGLEVLRCVHSHGVKLVKLGEHCRRVVHRNSTPSRAATPSANQRQATMHDMLSPSNGRSQSVPHARFMREAGPSTVTRVRGDRTAGPNRMTPAQYARRKVQDNLDNVDLQRRMADGEITRTEQIVSGLDTVPQAKHQRPRKIKEVRPLKKPRTAAQIAQSQVLRPGNKVGGRHRGTPKHISAAHRLADVKWADTLKRNCIVADVSDKTYLFCIPCTKRLSVTSHILKAHVKASDEGSKCSVHERNLKEHNKKLNKNVELAKTMAIIKKKEIKSLELGGSGNLPEGVLQRRCEVVNGHLKAGVALNLFDDVSWRGLFETDGVKLAGADTMRRVMPILNEHYMRLNTEKLVLAVWIHETFDGKTRLGELINVVGRLIYADFTIEKILIKLICCASACNGQQLATSILDANNSYTAVLTMGQAARVVISREKVAGLSSDGCSVNSVADEILLPVYSNAMKHKCPLHGTSNTAGALVTEERDYFMMHFSAMFRVETACAFIYYTILYCTTLY